MRASLRNCDGQTMVDTLTAEEIEAYEYLAMMGEVIKTQVVRKGRKKLIFTLKTRPIQTADPSNSRDTACCLTDGDMHSFVGAYEPGIEGPSRRQIERWAGYGLCAA